MSRRVCICAVSRIKCEPDIWYQRVQGMLLDCFEEIIEKTGVTFDMETGIRNVVTCSDDVFDARTISDNAVTDVVGAHFRGEEKTAQDGINAMGYAMASIMSGHDDIVLLMGHCKESQPESRNMCTNLAFEPFFTRPLGLDFRSAAALQADAYMKKSGVTDDHLAWIAARSRKNASVNPYAQENELLSVEEIKSSPMVCGPIREAYEYPVTDWAVAILLAAEERAHEFTDKPVFVTGFANCMDRYFLGDRDLADPFSLKKAAARAYKMAGIDDPQSAFDVIEVCDAYAHQLPLWCEGLGIIGDGQGGRWIEQGGPDRANVNLSGGMLAGTPLLLGGLARTVECFCQLRGEAGSMQVEGARRAVAHGATGPAGQHHGVLILERQ